MKSLFIWEPQDLGSQDISRTEGILLKRESGLDLFHCKINVCGFTLKNCACSANTFGMRYKTTLIAINNRSRKFHHC